MAAGKSPPPPLLLSANALLDGAVVYWTGRTWATALAAAAVARDTAAVATLEAALEAALAAEKVIAPELVPVRLDEAGRAVPSHYRARIRALGPTVRRDLGPQARGEHAYVSL